MNFDDVFHIRIVYWRLFVTIKLPIFTHCTWPWISSIVRFKSISVVERNDRIPNFCIPIYASFTNAKIRQLRICWWVTSLTYCCQILRFPLIPKHCIILILVWRTIKGHKLLPFDTTWFAFNFCTWKFKLKMKNVFLHKFSSLPSKSFTMPKF